MIFREKEINTLKANLPAHYHEQLNTYFKSGRSVSAEGRIALLVDYFEALEVSLGKVPTISLTSAGGDSAKRNCAAAA